MARPKRDLQRCYFNLPVHLVELVDSWAKANGNVSRTTAVTFLLAQALSQDDSVKK